MTFEPDRHRDVKQIDPKAGVSQRGEKEGSFWGYGEEKQGNGTTDQVTKKTPKCTVFDRIRGCLVKEAYGNVSAPKNYATGRNNQET